MYRETFCKWGLNCSFLAYNIMLSPTSWIFWLLSKMAWASLSLSVSSSYVAVAPMSSGPSGFFFFFLEWDWENSNEWDFHSTCIKPRDYGFTTTYQTVKTQNQTAKSSQTNMDADGEQHFLSSWEVTYHFHSLSLIRRFKPLHFMLPATLTKCNMKEKSQLTADRVDL